MIGFTKMLQLLLRILPPIFWCLAIFGFEEPLSATITLLCALIHEIGHLLCIFLSGRSASGVRGVLSGMRIQTTTIISYEESIMTCLAGPLSNAIAAIIALPFAKIFGDYFTIFALMNFATAISNLLPIDGYDGYRVIYGIIERKNYNSQGLQAPYVISAVLTLVFSLVSLYLIDRVGGGYWIFAIFFISFIKHLDRSLQTQRLR